ncbi:hypothetical protein M433DRAFT_151613 [Acidomyces richmondensis BFW]|nr:MAG: hypothetical protein FE78DRAFT_85730 [Acidomyces sp. 'richmondensis']KYG47948.1 hypothetical protein M433DRAFT_151613 [Acidomyces richmondensis BFW]
MSCTSLATPCPVPNFIGAQRRRLNIESTSSLVFEGEDTCTGNLDYTHAIQQEFKNSRPRRRPTFQNKAERNAAITIFEDVAEDQLVVDPIRHTGKRSTLLGKPAQRMHMMVVKRGEEWMGAQPLGECVQARRRVSTTGAASAVEDMRREPLPAAEEVKGRLKKHPRRRTIFVPSEDTTILTIHPGAHTKNRLNDTFQLSYLKGQQDRSAVQPVAYGEGEPNQRPRMSLAVAPKRIPLQQVTAKENKQLNMDVPGQNGGKENMPPYAESIDGRAAKSSRVALEKSTPHRPCQVSSRLFQSTAASKARQTVIQRRAVSLQKPQKVPRTVKPTAVQHTIPISSRDGVSAPYSPLTAVNVQDQMSQLPGSTSGSERARRRPERASNTNSPTSRPSRASKNSMFPVLSEDVAQPQLYEESWLSHQEIALTELINEIFVSANPLQEAWQAKNQSLRDRMLDIYNQPCVAKLHQRIQASLLYGALSPSRNMTRIPDPASDLGMRRQLLDFWLETYDHNALWAAAEVVVGRQIPTRACSFPGSLTSGKSIPVPTRAKRSLIGFLDSFFVSLEDINDTDSNTEELKEAKRWRKMVLRNLMLVWLLDRAKTCSTVDVSLFNPKSSLKSSTAVLHALSGVLVPSIGDIVRTLRHLDFVVSHMQDPLDEISYKIENIATDLRDGIFLTRLVEILLFRSHQPKYVTGASSNATVTITLPDSTVVESVLYTEAGLYAPKILSQHLKLPCLGRAQKIHNIQVALNAIAEHGGLANHVHDVTAEDIVDGHREKTLSLLWSLVSHHGLTHLVDWNELAADIRRAGGLSPDLDCFIEERRESMLQAWAAAHTKGRAVEIRNLTTSFSDGKAYISILEDFAHLIPRTTTLPPKRIKSTAPELELRLRSLGCSQAFIKQLTSSNLSIPSRTTTISNLIFLASRLLPLARRNGAAATIQRAFRQRLARKRVSQRVALMRLAHASAKVVQTQNRIISAAKTLQRAWRRVLDARISLLNRNVQSFQVLARAWVVRRKIAETRKLYGSDSVHSHRIMGGW